MNHNCFADRDTGKNYVIYASCAGQANGDGNGHFLYEGDFVKQHVCGLCGQQQYILIHVCAELQPTPKCTEMCGDCIIRGMQTDENKGMFRPQRHNTPLVTTLGLVSLMSEIEDIIAMISSKGVLQDYREHNLAKVLKDGKLALHDANLYTADPMCEVCAGIVDVSHINTDGGMAVSCSQCGGLFHKTCIDETTRFVADAAWTCYCCKRSKQVKASEWKWDLNIEQQVRLTRASCQAHRGNKKYILDGVVRIWKGDACIFFIAGATHG